MKSTIILTTLSTLVGLFQTASAQIITQDNFNSYADGALEIVSGGIWQQYNSLPAGQTPPLQVNSGRVEMKPYSGANGGGDGKIELGSVFGAGSTLFYGVDLNVASLGATPDTGLILGFRQPTNLGGTIFVKAPAEAGNDFRLGISSDSFSSAGAHTADLNFDTTYRLVMKLDVTAIGATATLWVDPTDETSPSLALSGTTSGRTYSQMGIYQTANSRSLDLWVDNLMVGTSFAAVVPEPSLTILGIGAAAGLLLVLRRRQSR